MANRWTITEKWQDQWFRKLTVEAKLFFLYLCDSCDIAGFWEIDLETASFQTKIPLKNDGIFESLSSEIDLEKIFKEISRGYLSNEKHIWIKNFIFHQGNFPFNPKNNITKGILKRFAQRDLFGEECLKYLKETEKYKGLARSYQDPAKTPCNGKGNGNGNVKGEYEGKRKRPKCLVCKKEGYWRIIRDDGIECALCKECVAAWRKIKKFENFTRFTPAEIEKIIEKGKQKLSEDKEL